jgi:hypothetical protein
VIGWTQILNGRWATQWVYHIEKITPDVGEKVLTKLTITIWQTLLKIWNERCDIMHQANQNSNLHTRMHLHPQVRAIYEQSDRLDTIDRRVLDTPIQETLKLPKKSLADWIKRSGNFVKIGIQRAHQRLKIGNNSTTKYFRRCSPPSIAPNRSEPQTSTIALNPSTHPPNQDNKENQRPP